jgi:hypothetical protein
MKVPKVLKKYEHMKAHENNKIDMSQIQKLEKEILSNRV